MFQIYPKPEVHNGNPASSLTGLVVVDAGTGMVVAQSDRTMLRALSQLVEYANRGQKAVLVSTDFG